MLYALCPFIHCTADCSVLQQLYAEGYEVATHSLSHQKVRTSVFLGVALLTPQPSCLCASAASCCNVWPKRQ